VRALAPSGGTLRRTTAALLLSVVLAMPALAAERRALVGYYPSWMAATTQPLSATSGAYTHVVIAFAKPDLAFNGKSWVGTGLQFETSLDDVRGQIAALHKRGIRVLLAVGGATYLNWAPLAAEADRPGPRVAALKRFAEALGFDGFDVDYETEGVGPAQVAQYRDAIKALSQAAGGKLLSLAAWSTGADCTAATGTAPCGGETTVWDGRVGRERLVFRDAAVLGKIGMISVMSYDAGTAQFDPVRAFALYRDLVPAKIPVNIGFEIAPEGWGGARLVASDRDAVCPGSITTKDQFGNKVGKPYSGSRLLRDGPLTRRPNANPRDGAMLWHIVKTQDMPKCGHSAVISPRELELKARVLLDRQHSATPAFSEDTDDH
jgi:hypothetical protein